MATVSVTVRHGPGQARPESPNFGTATNLLTFLEPRRMAENAMTAVLQEAYIQSISARSINDLVKAMGTENISKAKRPAFEERLTSEWAPF